MNRKKSLTNIYYACSVIWFLMALNYMFLQQNQSLGITYLSIGAMWLCIGSAFAAKQKKDKTTLEYYNEHATEFVLNTVNADVSEIRNKFLNFIPTGGSILDWGCGSGRDALAFITAGYQTDATDVSEEFCKLAREKTGIAVKCESFEELKEKEKYDGIWACASLLHIGKNYLPETLELAKKALKPGGVMYLSFKYGDFEGERNGRYFTDMTEEQFTKMLKHIRNMEIIEQWVTGDVRQDREDEKWLNILISKKNK